MWLSLSKQHPAFAGHFPGYPLAPGVVILDVVIKELKAVYSQCLNVDRIAFAKFNQPLFPDMPFRVQFETIETGRVKFHVTGKDDENIASGQISYSV